MAMSDVEEIAELTLKAIKGMELLILGGDHFTIPVVEVKKSKVTYDYL